MKMRELKYQVSFTTPAFLGNAEQQAQWRTPPFKALIRQWWRVVKAPKLDAPFDIDQLRTAENALFGAASDDSEVKSHRSPVRLRLSHWDTGALDKWERDDKVTHPEVDNPRGVGAALYLGFGPLTHGDTGKTNERGLPIKDTVLAEVKASPDRLKRTAIDEKAKALLRLMLPETHEHELCTALQLAAWFGTLGSRSRNGWGALQMAHDHLKPLTRANLESLNVTRALSDCLQEEWPHAIGKDDRGPLVWKTRVTGDWRAIMKELAKLKIRLRTEPKILSFDGAGDGVLAARQILAYPVTNHAVLGPVNTRERVAGWVDLDARTGRPKTDRNGKFIQGERLANQIRFKLAKVADGKLEGVIVHLPCKVPDELVNKLSPADRQFIRNNELAVWKAVHTVLDNQATRLK